MTEEISKRQAAIWDGRAAEEWAAPQGTEQSETNAMGRAKCELTQQQDEEQGGLKGVGGGWWTVETLIQTDTVNYSD